MATPRRTQKQIAEEYQGNLGYFSKVHLGRLARFMVSFLAISVGLAAIIPASIRSMARIICVVNAKAVGSAFPSFASP